MDQGIGRTAWGPAVHAPPSSFMYLDGVVQQRQEVGDEARVVAAAVRKML